MAIFVVSDLGAGRAQSIYLGFANVTAFLRGMTSSYPAGSSNLPRREVSRYGQFYGTGSATLLSAVAVLWGKRVGMVAHARITQFVVGQTNWPYGNGLT